MADWRIYCHTANIKSANIAHRVDSRRRRGDRTVIPPNLYPIFFPFLAIRQTLFPPIYPAIRYHDSSGSKGTSMDVSISCGSSSAARKNDDLELNSISVVSLSVAVFCASTLIILVALLIIRHMLRQKKKYTIR